MTELDRFFGIYPILYAFFGPDGELDRKAMRRQVEACVEGGAHGLAVLGLATEVNKLSHAERHTVLEWATEDLAGRLPLAVTVAEPTARAQAAFVQAAANHGASWVILQPPPVRGLPEIEYVRFFGAVADASPIPIAIQNAPEYIGIGLSDAGLETLRRNHPNFRLLKGEAPAVGIRRTIEATEGALRVFNGRGGLELVDCLRAGCAGMIPAPECFDVQVRIFELMRDGREEEALRLYAEVLPLITFLMSSIEQFLCYGKRLTARRLGLGEVHDRAPALRPTPFGLACLERLARELPPLR